MHTNAYTTTITVTDNAGDTQVIDNARLIGIVGGHVCIQVAEYKDMKPNKAGMKVGSGTITDYFVPMADVASVVLHDATIDGEDTYEAVGHHFNEDLTELVPA